MDSNDASFSSQGIANAEDARVHTVVWAVEAWVKHDIEICVKV